MSSPSDEVAHPRMKKYRELKARKDPNFKKKESERINQRQKHARAIMTDEEKEVKKLKHRKYMQQRRARQKLEKEAARSKMIKITCSSALSPRSKYEKKYGFKAKSSFARAVSRALQSVPGTPTKRRSVAKALAEKAGLTVVNDEEGEEQTQAAIEEHEALSEEIETKVKKFYFREDHVWTSPGLKDEMAFWDSDGVKSKLRKYYLELTIRELYFLFKEENPDTKIGQSKFYSLRPPNVLFMKDSPSDQCKCVQHEVFRMMLAPLKVMVNKDFWKKVLCDTDNINSKCWLNECEKCRNGVKLRELIVSAGMEDGQKVTWYTWITEESVTKGGKSIKRQVKRLKEGFVGELIELVFSCYPDYIGHVRRKRVMAACFQEDKSDESKVIIQCDFAQDYNCRDNAGEIQSAIYGRKNVTIFTCAIHFNNKWTSYAILTDSDKYKSTVRCCLLKIIDHFLENFDVSSKDTVIIWSDGPSNEFRNKFMTGKFLHEVMTIVKKPVAWKYFETSHGKGVVDGIGGSLKARVADHVRGKHRDNMVVQDFKEFYEVAKKYVPGVTLFLLPKEKVEEKTEVDQPWKEVLPLPGVGRIHWAKCSLTGKITIRELPDENDLSDIMYTAIRYYVWHGLGCTCHSCVKFFRCCACW